jgi:hypothetical protein
LLAAWLKQRQASRRADAVVRSILSEAERLQLRQTGFLEVRSRLVPGRKYRIPASGSPVATLEPNGRVIYLCLQPESEIPRGELVVLHKLMLEGAEAEYWQQANRVGRAMGRGPGRRLLG